MNTKTNQVRMSGYHTIDLLDGSTRLRMAVREEARAASAPAAVMSTEPARTAISRDAMAAALLLFCFTAVFWVILGFIRTH